MDVSYASIQIAVFALPGILWAGLDAATSNSAKRKASEFWLKVFVFALISYATLALAYRWTGIPFDAFSFEQADQNRFSDKADEIIWSVPIAILLGCAWIAGKTNGVIPRILRATRVSNLSGFDDIWEYALSKQSPVGKWVQLRDFEQQVIYEGWVKAYSDGHDVRELLLAHASVYGFDGEKAYDQHVIYLSRPANNMTLEFCLEQTDEQRTEDN